MFGAKWLDDNGQADFATDPGWANAFNWQHDFIANVYGDGDFQTGSDKVTAFIAGAGNEWNAQQDLGTGRVAMTLDGEWRKHSCRPSQLRHGRCPGDGHGSLYGGGSTAAPAAL
jgi:ABC-type glycerol-3-phosphate transport system substrate-binding protein